MSDLSAAERAKEVISKFFVERPNGEPQTVVQAALEGVGPEVRIVGDAFEHNISAVISMMGIPVTLSDAAARMRLWTQVQAAERIRSRGDEDRGSEKSEARALERANAHMQRHLEEGGSDIFVDDMCDFLLAVYETPQIPRALSDLHAQGIVLVWSAFEVLTRDLFACCLNSQPNLVARILEEDATRRLFQLKGLDFEVLSEHRFDVSRAMGDILLRFHDLGNLSAVKACFGALFPEQLELRDNLSDRELWILSQRRNLIVHRRGLVDARYLELTGEDLQQGSLLSITSGDVGRALRIACGTGALLVRVVADQVSKITPESVR